VRAAGEGQSEHRTHGDRETLDQLHGDTPFSREWA
jgi:hypothetical protein